MSSNAGAGARGRAGYTPSSSSQVSFSESEIFDSNFALADLSVPWLCAFRRRYSHTTRIAKIVVRVTAMDGEKGPR